MQQFLRINSVEYSIFFNMKENIGKKYIEEYNKFLEYLKIKSKNKNESIIIFLSKNRIFLLNEIFKDVDSLDWNFQKLKSKLLKMKNVYYKRKIIMEK